jgi:protease-4
MRYWTWIAAAALAVFALALAGHPVGVGKRAKGEAAKLRRSLDLGPERVAIARLDGEIVGSEDTVRTLRYLGEDVNGVRAIVLEIDTPGGSAASAQEICQEIGRLRKDGIKVVAAMGNTAASGGYYIAAACDEIVADPATVTGSIGVIMDSFQLKGALDKVGVRVEVVKSAEFKDAGSPFRDMTARDRVVFQGTINDVYAQFVDDVAQYRHEAIAGVLAKKTGRKASSFKDAEVREYVHSLADGRVYTGRQAYTLGLVDSLGGLQDAIDEATSLAELKDPQVITLREGRSLAEMVTGMNRSQWGVFLRNAVLGDAPRIGYLLR